MQATEIDYQGRLIHLHDYFVQALTENAQRTHDDSIPALIETYERSYGVKKAVA